MLKKLATHPATIATAIIGGIVLGIWAPVFSSTIGFVGMVYVNLLKMVVLPFMVSAIIFSMRQLFQMEGFERSIGKVAFYFLAAIALSAVIGAATGGLAGPGRGLEPETLIVFGKMVEKSTGTATDYELPLSAPEAALADNAPRQVVQQIIPDNIFAALSQGDSIKILFFAILFGIAFGFAPNRIADSLSLTLESVYRACQILINGSTVLPPGLVAFAS
jgi:Na+/H+-dicarboxylate symporter